MVAKALAIYRIENPEIQKIGEKLAKYRKIRFFCGLFLVYFSFLFGLPIFLLFSGLQGFSFCRWPRLSQSHGSFKSIISWFLWFSWLPVFLQTTPTTPYYPLCELQERKN